VTIARIDDFAEESNDILTGNDLASGYVLHENATELSSSLVLKADEFIDRHLNITLIGKSLYHRGECFIFSFAMRDNV